MLGLSLLYEAVGGQHIERGISLTFYREAGESRERGITYHLVPQGVWDAQRNGSEYLPEAYPTDGFIHCTNGLDQLLKVANMFYTADSREFVVLALDVARIASNVRYDDADKLFPHVYGPLNTDAVVAQASIERSADGSFVSIPT